MALYTVLQSLGFIGPLPTGGDPASPKDPDNQPGSTGSDDGGGN